MGIPALDVLIIYIVLNLILLFWAYGSVKEKK
jgi:hypothetical protein